VFKLQFLLDIFEANSNEIAIVYDDKTYNYSWFLNQIELYSDVIKSKKIENKIIFFKADVNPYSIAFLLACIKNNIIIIPYIYNNSNELDDLVSISSPQLIIEIEETSINIIKNFDVEITNELYLSLIKNKIPGLVLFSSGTSGSKKAIVHDFNKILSKYTKSRKNYSTLAFMFFDHIGGIDTLFYSLSNASTLILSKDRFPKDICYLIEKWKIQVLPTTPTFLNLLILSEEYKKYDLSSLKYITYGTEVMHQSTLNKTKEIFPNCEIIQKFGATEVGTLGSKSESSDSLWMKLGGKGFETRIIENKLQIKSNSAMLGYLNAPSPFTKDGWYMTGDLVEEKDGFIRIIGRESNIINVGGEKVNPNDVENIIKELDIVNDIIVFGEKNPFTGNIVVAEIVLNPKINNTKDAKNIIKEHCKSHLQKYQIPVKFTFTDNELFSERYKKIRNR